MLFEHIFYDNVQRCQNGCGYFDDCISQRDSHRLFRALFAIRPLSGSDAALVGHWPRDQAATAKWNGWNMPQMKLTLQFYNTDLGDVRLRMPLLTGRAHLQNKSEITLFMSSNINSGISKFFNQTSICRKLFVKPIQDVVLIMWLILWGWILK